jgi:O-antigen ligase
MRSTKIAAPVPKSIGTLALPLGAAWLVGSLLVMQPRLLVLLFGSGFVASLTIVAPEVFVAVALLARNLASGTADIQIAGGLNSGALIGLVVVFVVAMRLLAMARPRAVGIALVLSSAIAFWFIVGYWIFGPEESIIREFIRSLSIVALALLAINVPRGPASERLISAVILAAAVPAVMAIAQLATGSGFETENSGTNTGRAYGTLSGPAEAVSVFTIALALVLWRMSRGTRTWGYVALAVMFGLAALATKSMGGAVQIVVTLVAYGILSGHARRLRGLTILAAVAAAAIFALTPLGRDRLEELGSTKFATTSEELRYTTNSADWRLYNWLVQLEEWRKRPYFGHGAGTTATIVHPGGNIPHSDYVRLLVEAGILGFVFFGVAYALLFKRLRALARRADDHASYCTAALAILIGLTVHALTDNVSTQTATMYSAAIVIGCAFAARPESIGGESGNGRVLRLVG